MGIQCATLSEDSGARHQFSVIAETINEIWSGDNNYIRFIAVELQDKSGITAVKSPPLRITSDIVEAALKDAEHLINRSGAVNGLDRVHTALHGYLKAACDRSSISYPSDVSTSGLYKLMREAHPLLASPGPNSEPIDRVIKSISTIIDALNPLRNRGSLAHANQNLLEPAEAMLAINAVRTLLHYLDTKLVR